MKTTTLFIVTSVLLSGLASTALAGAATPADNKKKTTETSTSVAKAPEKSTADNSKRDHYPLVGEVVSVSDKLLVLKGGKGKGDRKYDITPETRIVKDDKPASVKDIKEGQRVTGSVHKMDKGNPQLVSLNLSPKQKEKIADNSSSEKKPEMTAQGKKRSS